MLGSKLYYADYTREQIDELKEQFEQHQEIYNRIKARHDEIMQARTGAIKMLDEHQKSLLAIDVQRIAAWASTRAQLIEQIDALNTLHGMVAEQLRQASNQHDDSRRNYYKAIN